MQGVVCGRRIFRWLSTKTGVYQAPILTKPVVELGIDRYWIEQLTRISRPSAVKLAAQLVPSNSLGFPGAVDCVDPSAGALKLRVVDMATAWKRMHRDMVLLVRLGDFYEAWGVDAVMLVEHAGLNPMGESCRAGCPKGNIQQTLNSLTEAGLSVAVYEEANVVGSRSKKIRKERYLSQVVTPGRPIYLHDTCLKEGDLPYRQSKPYAAIRCSNTGDCAVAYFQVDAREIRITESITEDALASSIESVGGIADPVWLCLDKSNQLSRIRSYLPNRSKRFPISLSMDAFLTAATTELSQQLSLEGKFSISKNEFVSNQMQALHASAALFLGLHRNSPSPDLVKYLVGPAAPFHCEYFLRSWLLCPPPLEVTQAMRGLLFAINATNESLPKLRVVPVDKLVRLLESRNGNVHFFTDLMDSCSAYIGAASLCREEEVFKIVNYFSGLRPVNCRIALGETAEAIASEISAHVHLDKDVSFQPVGNEALDKFVRLKESEFILSIKGDYSQLALARATLVTAVTRSLTNPETSLKFDQIRDKLYVKDIDTALRTNGDAKKKLVPDEGSTKKRYSTDLIQKAELEYRAAVESARETAKRSLQNLCKSLSSRPMKETLMVLSHWAVVVSSAIHHSESGIRKGWVLSQVVGREAGDFGVPQPSSISRLESVWPYWLERGVANSVQLDRGKISILTAPNMSGKSTFIRAIAAAVLLGNCGLMIPAKSGSIVASFTHLLVVSPNGDRPIEGLSAFAAEADSMSVALREVQRAGSTVLLLVDEFGRGTSGRDASALSAAVLNWLANQGNVACVWATHLHEVFAMRELDLLDWIQMDTFKVAPGQCVDSKGIDTAHERGFPQAVVDAAFRIVQDTSRAKLELPSSCHVHRIHKSVFPDTAQPVEVIHGSLPPPRIQSSPLVYILRFDERYYIGETENFSQRLKAHQRRFKSHPHQVWYMQQSNRSRARETETLLIQAYQKEGIPLLSITDGNHRLSSASS